MAADPRAVFRRRPDVRFREVGSDAVVLVQEDARVLGLNPTGAAVLEALDGRRTLAEVEASLAERFDAEPVQLRADLLAIVDELRRLGVVEEVQGGAP